MDLQTRKIEFIQEFLKLQSEDVISQLENLLKKKTRPYDENHIQPMSVEEFNEGIDKSEDDFKNKNFKTSATLLSKYRR